MYNVNSDNNTFTITENNAVFYSISIPIGNYNDTTLSAELKTQLDNSSATGVFTVSVSSTTGKITITSTVGFNIVFTTDDNKRLLGFNNDNLIQVMN
jgi:hypothetical protein